MPDKRSRKRMEIQRRNEKAGTQNRGTSKEVLENPTVGLKEAIGLISKGRFNSMEQVDEGLYKMFV